MTLEVPNLFVILALAFFFLPMMLLALCGCLNSFWRVKRKKKQRQHETYATEEFEEEKVPNVLPQTAFESLYGYESEEGDDEE